MCLDPYVSPGCTIQLVFFCSLSALFQHVDLVTTSLWVGFKLFLFRPWVLSGFYVHRPMQADSICWELNLISGFFGFFWLIVWLDVVNKCGWFLAGGRGCWLKGLHQIPIVSWIIHHLLHFHISLIYARNSVSIVLLLWRMGGWHTFGGGWLISGCGWRDKGRVLFNFFFLICAFVFCCFRSCFIF